MKDTYQYGELSKEVLLAFLAGGFALTCIMLPGMAEVVRLFKPRNRRERYKLKRTIDRLQTNGYIKRRIRNGVEELSVTSKGRQKLATYVIGDLSISPMKTWDGVWRVLMFDIPNTKEKIRREVSFHIKDMGMRAIQDSVFVSPFPCKEEIDFLVAQFGLHKYFIYLESSDIECSEDLLKMFKLKNVATR